MTTSAIKVIVAALDDRWDEYREQLKACRQDAAQEAVHDLRVTARRLLAVLALIRDLHPEARMQKARRVPQGPAGRLGRPAGCPGDPVGAGRSA